MSLKQFISTKFDQQVNKTTQCNKDIEVVNKKDIGHKTNKPKILSKYILLRVLKDIPVFVGHDMRNYKLNIHDVATIPLVNANTLIKRKVAIEVNTNRKL